MEITINAKLLAIDVKPRYLEDAKINGIPEYTEEEIHEGKPPKMPLMAKKADGWHWILSINLDKGYIVAWPKGITAEVCYKVCDEGDYLLIFTDFDCLSRRDIYVPSILDITGKSFGDYLDFKINEDGYIENFPKGKVLIEKIIDFIK